MEEEAIAGGLFSVLRGGVGTHSNSNAHGVRRSSTNSVSGPGGTSFMGTSNDEGLGLLRQQLSAVQRIRIEHERKDTAIAALRLEVGGWVGGCGDGQADGLVGG